jgi:hypothetical protein
MSRRTRPSLLLKQLDVQRGLIGSCNSVAPAVPLALLVSRPLIGVAPMLTQRSSRNAVRPPRQGKSATDVNA